MNINSINIQKLKFYDRNPKQHDSDQVRQIAASIKAFGFNVPILADSNGEVIAGHGRLLAAQQLGLDTVPVINLDHLDEQQKRAFMLADNRLNELGGGWNKELLSLDLSDLLDADFDIELTGFTKDDLQDTGLAITDEDCERADEAPELIKTPVTVLGDTWQLGNHKLMCADATKKDAVMSFIQNDDIEMMFTDPPYGINYNSNKNGIIMGDRSQATIPFSFEIAVVNVLNKNARIYLCGGGSNIQMYYLIFDRYLKTQPRLIIWVKENQTLRPSNYHSQYEIIFFGFKNRGIDQKYWQGGRTADNCSDVFKIHRDLSRDYLHPTQKPVELPLRCITNSSKPGDLVYDPFGGSGSTLMACEQSGRHCRMIELDPCFCDVIVKRWQAYTEQQAVLVNTGQSWQQVQHERQETTSN